MEVHVTGMEVGWNWDGSRMELEVGWNCDGSRMEMEVGWN